VPVPEYLMNELEDELQNPTGVQTVPPPALSMDGIWVSKECGVLYEISNTEGLRSVFQIIRTPCFLLSSNLGLWLSCARLQPVCSRGTLVGY
jgi:hypothetical protein